MNVEREKLVYAEDNIIKTAPMQYAPEKGGLGHEMFQALKAHSNSIGQIDPITGKKETHGSILLRSIRASLHMLEKGIIKDDIVCLCVDNNLDSSVLYFASLFIGTRICVIDPTQSTAEFEHLLKLMEPKMLFIIPQVATVLECIIKKIELDTTVIDLGQTSWSEFMKKHPDEETFQPVFIENLKETIIIAFSSGTTGFAKGMCISHHAMLCQLYCMTYVDNPDVNETKRRAEKIKETDCPFIMINNASLYWLSQAITLFLITKGGACRLLVNDFDAKLLWEYIDEYKPRAINLVPSEAVELCRYGKPENVDTSCIFAIFSCGSAISLENFMLLRNTFPEAAVHQSYGQTETCSVITIFKSRDTVHREYIKNKPMSVGPPPRGTTLKIVDVETNEALGPHKKGELRIKAPTIMNGYYKRETSSEYDEDGWFKTGDIAYYDEDFCFYIVDRIRELFKYQGWHITPALLETELLNHPAVSEAAVIGIPHDEDGDHPMGVVVLRDNCKNVTGEEIEKFMTDRVLERQRLRAGVKLVDSLPITPTGKVNKRLLKEKAMNGQL